MTLDPVEFAARLIRCPTVTPQAAPAIDLVQRTLRDHGFACTRVDRNGIANLYARHGREGPVLGFNGHVDVVPTGDPAAWSSDPFGGELRDGKLWGRGACDMKSAVAAFAAAAIEAVEARAPSGSLVLAITGDEEGDGVDGTAAILDWMEQTGERLDACLVGEPTCPARMGEMIKIGRRGSMTAWITAQGLQGHSAYPAQARNPIHAMMALLTRLTSFALPDASDHFDPTSVQVTGLDTGNRANNVIPAQCTAMVNTRFNDAHSSASLTEWIEAEAAEVTRATGVGFDLRLKISGESFVTAPGALSDLVQDAVEAETGLRPVLSTSGGTSDARHLRRHCPVVEVGLVNATMHQVDEHVDVAHIHQLTAIYGRILRAYFRVSLLISVTDDLAACHALRRAVFIEEQGVSEAEEMDDLDGAAIHLLARQDGLAVGTARLLIAPPVGKIGRVAVARPQRGTGLGRALMRAALDVLARRGDIATAGLGAQLHALEFYRKLGFEAEGPIYSDAGIPHRWMSRPL